MLAEGAVARHFLTIWGLISFEGMFEMTFNFHDHLGHDLALILDPKNVRFGS